MKIVTKSELKIDGFDKCSLICDSDCPLGHLYDYVSNLKSFVVDKMKEVEKAQKAQESDQQDNIKHSES